MWMLLGCAMALGASVDEDGAEAHGHGALALGRSIGSLALEHGEREALFGGGVALERELGHHLAVEIGVSKLYGQEVEEVPLELVFARTWWIGDHVEPFAGGGPLLVFRSRGHREAGAVRLGGVALVGAHLWAAPTWGVVIETAGHATYDEGLAVAAEGIFGLVFRWR